VGLGSNTEITKKNGERITLTLSKAEAAAQVWSPVRFPGENFLTKRHFERVPEHGRVIHHYNGKSSVVVTEATLVQMDFFLKQQRITTTLYVQRYDQNGFAKDSSLQKLMNQL